MPITEAQRQRRRDRIGSSDSAAICGVDPYRSAHDVYLSKVHDLEDIEGNAAIDIGNRFEAPLLAWAAEELGFEIEVNVGVDGPDGLFAANLDAKVVGKRVGIEAKTTSNAGEYGEPGTDQVPNRVIIQAHHQMMVAGLELVYVPVLLARFDRLHREMYVIERNDQVVDAITTRGKAFWTDHVAARVPPPDVVPSLDVVRRVRRVAGTEAIVPSKLAEDLEAAKAATRAAKKTEDEAKAAMLAAMGDCEAADCGDPKFWYTFLEQTRTSIDAKRLRVEHPRIANTFTKVSRFRVLRRSKRK